MSERDDPDSPDYQCFSAGGDLRMTPEEREIERLTKEVARLEGLVYVPGVFRCPKCNFRLVSQTLYMKSGTVGANNAPQRCGNGCGPMWRVSERDDRRELFADMLSTRNNALEQAAVACERQIEQEENRARLQARSVLTRCAAAIRDLKVDR